MKLTFVGTGSGKTNLSRYHSSIYIESGGGNLLIDAGDSISRAMMANNIKFNNIQNIYITHNHTDHLGGLASLVMQMRLSNRNQELNVYLHESAVNDILTLLNTHYIFIEKLPFELKINPYSYDNTINLHNGIEFTPVKNSHINPDNYPPSYNVAFYSSSLKLKVDQSKLFYSSDVGSPKDLKSLDLNSLDYLILETTHISLDSILEINSKYSPQTLLLTHIDEEKESEIEYRVNALSPALKDSVKIAYDGLIIY